MVKIITRRSVLLAGTATVAWTSVANAELLRSFAAGASPSGPPPAPVITSSATASATVGDAFFYQITATNSPTSFGAAGLPADGLSLNTSTGVISGTPSSATTLSLTISATNAGGTGTGPLSITVSSSMPGSTAAQALAALTGVNVAANTPFSGTSDPTGPNYYVVGVTSYPTGYDQQVVTPDGSYCAFAVQSTFTASSFPTTMTLVQDGAIAGGVPTNTFGWVFRPGDIPYGSAPRFQVSGVTWGYSHGLQTYWPDGSLKAAAFCLMVPASPPSFPATVTISAVVGSWPAASSRTLTEVYLQALVVNLKTPAVAIPNNIRSADLFAALVSDSNNYRAVKDLDGAAGARWKISTKAATSIGGTADTEIIVDHYIFAMNNASGGLGGFRWFGNIRNPLRADQSGGSDGEWVAFQPPSSGSPSTGLNWSINPGSTPNGSGAVYTPVQHPFNTINFNNGFTTSAASTATNVLTITGSPSSFVMPAANVTLTVQGSFPWMATVTAIDRAFYINTGGHQTLIAAPAGITVSSSAPNNTFGLLNQVSSSEPDGSLGKRGVYNTDNATFSSGFTNTCIASSTLQASFGSVGLYDGSALTGQYQILAQLTTLSGDDVGLRGTYALSGSPGTIGSEAMSYYSTLTLQTDVPPNWYSGATGPSGSIDGNRMFALISGSPPPLVPGVIPLTTSDYACPMATYVAGGLYSFTNVGPSQGLTVQNNSGVNDYFTGPGSGTLTPIPALIKYARFQLATADAKYWFFQGTGSIVADTTTRVQINQAYWQSTCCFPPIDLSLIGVIPDTGYTFDWNPYNCGVCRSTNIDGFGPPNEVGHMNSTCIIDFYNQSKLTEKEARIFGLYAGTTPCDWKDKNTAFDQMPPMGPGASGTTPYTGLPAIPPNGGSSAFPVSGFYDGLATDICNPTHEPQFGYWATLRFGELQYFDYVGEWAQVTTSYQQWGSFFDRAPVPSPPWPYATQGNVVAQGQPRGSAWTNRDIQQRAFLCSYNPNPTAYPGLPVFDYGGTQLAQYFLDHADDQPRLVRQAAAAANSGICGSSDAAAYVTTNPGAYQIVYNSSNPGTPTGAEPWEWDGYFYGGMLYAALRGNPDATQIIADHIAFIDKIANHSIQAGDYGGTGYTNWFQTYALQNSDIIGQVAHGVGPGGANAGIVVDTSFCGQGIFWFGSASITQWVPNGSGNAFTLVGTIKVPWYNQQTGMVVGTVQNNDAFTIMVDASGGTIVNDGSQYPLELTINTTYYIRDLIQINSTTWTFNVAATKGGAAIAITSTNLSPHILGLESNWVSSKPDVLDSNGPTFLWEVGVTWNWVHAVASSSGPNGVNQFAGFT